MELKSIRIIKSDDRGVIYDCGKCSFISRKKGSVSADHKHADSETVYLLQGTIKLTDGNETQVIKAPVMFKHEPHVYHKLVALTDIELVIYRDGEL